MVAGSILPVAWHKGKLYFLFGKENPMEDSAKGFSDFGGGVDKDETPYDTAMREGAEELTGFLGDEHELRALIKKNGGTYNITVDTYHVHIFAHEYDENLPKHYNQNHRFLWSRMNQRLLNKTKLFEKIEIQWFTLDQMKSRIKEFRGFYQEMVKRFIEDQENITQFVKSKSKKIPQPQQKKNKTVRK